MSEITSYVDPKLGPLPTSAPKLSDNVLDLFSLKGKVASITGSSQGIGLAVAEAYAQAGANVAIWYNNTPADQLAIEISNKYHVKCKAYKCKVQNFNEVESTIKSIVNDFGKIDIFVANAGMGSKNCPVAESSLEDYHNLMQVNVDSVYYAAKCMGPIFESQGKGSFIITASQAGQIVTLPTLQTAYNATKAALIQIGRSLSVEWIRFARVNTISPGYILTEIAEHIPYEEKCQWWPRIPMGREGSTKELVGAFLYFASDASTFTTGADLLIDGGYTAT